MAETSVPVDSSAAGKTGTKSTKPRAAPIAEDSNSAINGSKTHVQQGMIRRKSNRHDGEEIERSHKKQNYTDVAFAAHSNSCDGCSLASGSHENAELTAKYVSSLRAILLLQSAIAGCALGMSATVQLSPSPPAPHPPQRHPPHCHQSVVFAPKPEIQDIKKVLILVRFNL